MPVLESDSENDSWPLSLEYSFSLNPFSLGLWFCSEYFTSGTSTGPQLRQVELPVPVDPEISDSESLGALASASEVATTKYS